MQLRSRLRASRPLLPPAHARQHAWRAEGKSSSYAALLLRCYTWRAGVHTKGRRNAALTWHFHAPRQLLPRHRNLMALPRGVESFTPLLQYSLNGFAVVDGDGRYAWVSDSLCLLLALDKQALLGCVRDCVACACAARQRCMCLRSRSRGLVRLRASRGLAQPCARCITCTLAHLDATTGGTLRRSSSPATASGWRSCCSQREIARRCTSRLTTLPGCAMRAVLAWRARAARRARRSVTFRWSARCAPIRSMPISSSWTPACPPAWRACCRTFFSTPVRALLRALPISSRT